MNKLEKLIRAYQDNRIDEQQLLKQIEKFSFMDEKQQDIQQERIINKLVSHMTTTYSVTPEEYVLEKEKYSEILEFIYWVNSMIGDKDFQLLLWYAVDRLSYREIAKRLGVTAPAVYTKLHRIYEKINKYMHLSPIAYEDIIGHLVNPPSCKEAGSPESMGYPHEFLQHISIDGRWHTSARGRKKYISKSTCRIPEYFLQCFGDDKTVCTLECNKKCSIGGANAATSNKATING